MIIFLILLLITIDGLFEQPRFSSTPPRCLTFINGKYIEHECEVYDESR
jgi:hypothetical protein